MTPMQTFAAWRADLEGELVEGNESLELAKVNLVTAEEALRLAREDHALMQSALAPLTTPVSTWTGQLVESPIAPPLALRVRDADRGIHGLEGEVVRAQLVVDEARRTVAQLELSLAQLDQVTPAANLEATAEIHQ
jgi:hypothetical protein